MIPVVVALRLDATPATVLLLATAGIFIGLYAESRILFGQFIQTYSETIEISLGLRLNCHTYNRLGEIHRLKNYRVFFVAQGVACTDIFKSNCRANISGLNKLNRILLIGVHLEHA